jgi:hypothetical protein
MSACHEVAVAVRVFIGTVESVEPSFLNRWNPSKSSSLPLSQQLVGGHGPSRVLPEPFSLEKILSIARTLPSTTAFPLKQGEVLRVPFEIRPEPTCSEGR